LLPNTGYAKSPYYSTKEAADRLGLSPTAVRDAVWRGTIKSLRVGVRLTMIAESEVDRYAAEQANRRGWDKRKDPTYQPDTRRRAYQRAYRERKRTRNAVQAPAADADSATREQPRGE